jgi:proteasome lid subunit RPN8/RPN11
MTSLEMSVDLLQRIQAHGESHYPNEGAGLMLGKVEGEGRQVTELLPLDNDFAEDERYHRYQISPRAMLEAQQEADARDLDIIGVFHSHPDHPAQPSEFDRQWALPWFSYVITRIESGRAKDSRSWRLSEDRSRFDEEPLDTRIYPAQEVQ